MRLLKQVGKDVVSEVAWILFFAIIASISIYALAFCMEGSISENIGMRKSSEKISQSDAYFVKLMSTTYNDDIEPEPQLSEEEKEKQDEIIKTFFKKNCCPEKRMIGAVYAMGENSMWDSTPYKNVYILIGAYAYMSNFKGVSEDYPAIAVSSDIKGKVGKEKYNGCEITDVLPDDFGLYGPGIHIAGTLKNTLVVFATDYNQFKTVIPDTPFQRFIERMLFVNSTEADRAEFANIISRVGRGYVSYSTFEEETRLDDSYRNMVTTIMIYSIAVVVLIGSMVFNTVRTVRRKSAEYTIQHLYGANCLFIYARMFLFIISYYSVSIILFYILNRVLHPIPTEVIIAIIGVIVLLSAAVALEELLNFKKQFSKGLIRREN